MQKHSTRCAECREATGQIVFKTVLDGYEKDFCDPICVLRWVRKQTETDKSKLQEAIA